MEKEELEAGGVGADDLLESPLESSSAAYAGVRITLDRRLVHRHHYPSWLALHLLSLSLSFLSLRTVSLPGLNGLSVLLRVACAHRSA